MSELTVKAMQQNRIDRGKLQIQVKTEIQKRPIAGAKIVISYKGAPGETLEEVQTDANGQTEMLELPTPPVEYSLEPSEQQPYSEYNISVQAPGYEPIEVSGSELLSGQTSIQSIAMHPLAGEDFEDIIIPDHTLFGNYPEKIPESEIKPMNETGEIVLSRVVIPEYVVVHDGVPTDTTARNHYVRYRDYIKNVASSEIYATWPTETIKANVLAIMSFTLNRVYTEWYRNKGYDFTITSSTAFDHKWMFGRNIFDSISQVVDELFESYLSRPNVRQPILTQYCDGHRVTCPDWMSQWGSCYLGEQNYSAIEILRNYYGDNMYINTAEAVAGVPASWPGYNLDIGASGAKVRQIQEQLNTISQVYTAIPSINPDGIYGEATKNAVRRFQSVFGMPQTGIVDYSTWYEIQEIFVAITRIAELT
ncbi:MAG: peptidoglycan-binding protein [Clostridiales bacterium]|nr:peptidoglycan-binding protein [Clostridiales bacterium]